jgi:hypothetical protein
MLDLRGMNGLASTTVLPSADSRLSSAPRPRLGLTIVNFGFRVVTVQFRVFLHRPELILAAAEQNGFRTKLNQRGLVWQVTALERTVWRRQPLEEARNPVVRSKQVRLTPGEKKFH